MVQQVRAYGQILQFPDGMSDADMAKAIQDNEHVLNPDFKQPEGLSGIAKNVVSGVKQTGRMVGAGFDTVRNKLSGVEEYAKSSDVARQQETPVEQRKLLGELSAIDRDQGALGQIGDTLKAAGRNPMGTAQMITEQLPNTAVSLGGGYAGFKTGALAGSVLGPVGATVGGALGFLGGMFLGNALLETGSKAIEKASDEDGYTPEDRDAALREGAVKGAVITGVDAATLKIGSMVTKRLGSAAVNAGAKAEAKVLMDAGVDMTNTTTINAALKSSPKLMKQARMAGERAAIESMSRAKKAGIIGTGVALETAGEGVGEYAGEMAATGKGDVVDATIEALSSATQSIAETAYNFNKLKSGNDLSTDNIRKVAGSVNDIQLKEGLDNIGKSESVDQAIQAAVETVSTKPVNSDDVLTAADPSLLDIERLTGLKPTEAIEQITNPQGDVNVQSEASQETEQKTNAKPVPVLGNDTEIVLPDGQSIPAKWGIVDADNVSASIKEGINQPRDRTRAASDIQIQNIANNPDYRRLSDSVLMDTGSPTLSQDGLIVGGNGRFEGINRSHEIGRSTKYRESLLSDSLNKGIDPSLYQDMKKPVLVRQITQPFDTRKLAVASNSGTNMQYSGLELAKIDADRMTGIEDLDIADNGDIAITGGNIQKIRQALSDYNPTEVAGLVDKNGVLSQDGVKRVRNAILAKAYGNSETLGRMVESTDNDMRNVLGALTRTSGTVAKVRADIQAGAIPKEMDITENLLNAVETLGQIRSKGQPLDHYFAQENMFGDNIDQDSREILQYLHDNIRSQKKMAEFINNVYEQIGRIDQSTEDIFGDNPVPTKKEVIDNAKPTEQQAEQQGFFDGAPKQSGQSDKQKPTAEANNAASGTKSWVIREKLTGKVIFETSDKKKVDALNTEKYEAVPTKDHLVELNDPKSKVRQYAERPNQNEPEFSRSAEERLKDRERAKQLETKLKAQGYNFRITARDLRDFSADDRGKADEAATAEKIAKIFGRRVVWIEAKGDHAINGVVIPSIKDTVYIDVNTKKAVHAVLGHELSHHLEFDKPEVYKELTQSLKTVITNHAKYAKAYGMDGASEANVTREIVGDIMGDSFADPQFWNRVAEANPGAFKSIADTVIAWLKKLVTNAKMRGMGSEQWVTDVKKAQDIVADAVAKYTSNSDYAGSEEAKLSRSSQGSLFGNNSNLVSQEEIRQQNAKPGDLFANNSSAENDPALPEGFSFMEGKGLAAGKFAVTDISGDTVSNFHADKQNAVYEFERNQVLKNQFEENSKRNDEIFEKISNKLLAGEKASDDDLKGLNLKQVSRFDYISPVIQKLFGISKSKVRESMGSALFKSQGIYGGETFEANSKSALENAAKYINSQNIDQDIFRPETTGKIDDFGEKLGGARKDMDRSLNKEYTDDDIATQPLSKIWPKDDYLNVEDPFLSAFYFAAREEIPTKPKLSYRVNSWVEKVKMFRGLAKLSVSGAINEQRILEFSKKFPGLDHFFARAQVLSRVPNRLDWTRVERISIYPDAGKYDENGIFVNTPMTQIKVDGRTTVTNVTDIDQVAESVNNLLQKDAPSSDKKMQFEIRGRVGSYFINKKGDREYRKLKTFTDLKEARDYFLNNHDDLVAAWELVKESDNVKKSDIRSEENRPRTGQDWRHGRDVSPEQFQDAFGFRGVEFGNWVSQGKDNRERQGMLNQAYDALMDLSNIIGVPPKALSLDGSLGLGFGSRGKGAALAHFEPDALVINLTKTKGAGNLAHEWFHAMDNYFQRQRGSVRKPVREDMYVTYRPEPMMMHKKTGSLMTQFQLEKRRLSNPGSGYFSSENWIKDPKHPLGVRPEIEGKFSDLVKTLDQSPMKKRAEVIDKGKEDGYWSRIIERAARSFENYVIAKMMKKGYNNDYLANVTNAENFARDKERYPYLLESEVAPVEEAFDSLFSEIKTKETDKGVAMFSRRIHGDEPNNDDYVVPETPEFEGNMTGDLAYTPQSAIEKGVEQLPIRMRVGEAKELHRGYGIRHIADNAANESRRMPKNHTDDLAENISRDVAEISGSFTEIYADNNRYILRLGKLNRALIVEPRNDNGDRFYSVITEMPLFGDSAIKRYGKPVWSQGRLTFPNDRVLQSSVSRSPIGQESQQPTRQGRRNQTSKFHLTADQPKNQDKLQTKVTIKKRRVVKQSDGDDGPKFSFIANPAISTTGRNDIPKETNFRKAQRLTQDAFNRFTVIKDWLAERGVKLSEKADVYAAEERYHSRVANQLEDFREKIRNPLIEKIAKAGFTLSDVSDFLEAQHAEEANAAIQKLTDDPSATAYGITDKEAQDYLKNASPELATLANELRNVTQLSKELRLKNGLLSQEEVDAWEATYKHYIPVKGDSEANKGTGKGLKVNFKTKRRLGHGRRDEAVIENILMDHERAIMQVEKNRVAKHLVMMAAEIGMPEIMTIGQPEKRKVLKNTTAFEVQVKGVTHGVFDTREAANMFKKLIPATNKNVAAGDIVIVPTTDQRVVAMASQMLSDNEVNAYFDGHAIRIQINDELLARAYGKLGVTGFSAIVNAGRALNGYLSKVYTGYNPEFIITNLIRDFTSGVINLTGEQGIKMAAKTVGNYGKSFASLLKYAATGESDRWIDRYRNTGGNTGAAYLSDLERLGDEVKTEFASYQGVISNLKQKDFANAARAAGRKVFNKTLKWIYVLNQAGENAMRLSAFRAMIESGESPLKAASVAKNITVNFNRKGEFGAEANAAYLFFNASVQGTAAIAHSLTKGEHKYQALALSGAMTTLGYLAAAALAGGDEDEYDKINDYTKERNLLIKAGDGFVQVPVPYGYGFFWNLGRSIADAQRKGEMGKLPWHIASSAIEELTPFSDTVVGNDGEFQADQVFLGLLPTVAKIPAQPILNKQLFSGGELMPDSPFKQFQPDREKMWRATQGTMFDHVAGWLEAGLGMDVSPETLKHYTRTLTGGAGNMVDTSISAGLLKAQGVDLETSEIPFYRKAYTELTIKDHRAAYYKASEEAKKAAEEFSRAKEKNDLSLIQKVLEDKKELIALDKYASKLSKVIGVVRDEQDAIRMSDSLTAAEKRLRIREIELREEKLYDKFLDAFKTKTINK